MKKKIRLSESKLKNIINRIIKEEFSDATAFTKSLWTIVPNAALKEIKSKGGLFPYNGDTSVATKGVYLCNDKNAIQAYCSPNSSYVEVDLGKLMSSLKGTRNANIQKRDFHGSVLYIVPYVPSDCISSVEPCGRGGQLQEEKHLNKLTESRLNRIIKESVRRVLKENTEMVNNKNYVFDPSTRTGIDRTMGYDMKFRYTGNNLENFTNLLRRSDGDNFNPDWLESCPGVEFDDNGYGSSYGSQQDAQELQELRNKIKAAGGMLVQGDIEQGIEKYASPATMNMLNKVGDAVVWIIELYDNEYYVSQKPYQSDESAYRACDKVLKMLGQDLNAEVCSLFYEDGELMADTLMYKETGDDFWMD